MEPRYFVVEASVSLDIAMELKFAAGPFSTEEAANAAAASFKQPGKYITYGPAEAIHVTEVSAPVVNSQSLKNPEA